MLVTPLVFTDWLRLIPASLTAEYWQGKLSPDVALPFYYEGIEKGTAQLQRDYPGRKIQIVSHSIGGEFMLTVHNISFFGCLAT